MLLLDFYNSNLTKETIHYIAYGPNRSLINMSVIFFINVYKECMDPLLSIKHNRNKQL